MKHKLVGCGADERRLAEMNLAEFNLSQRPFDEH